MSASPLVVVIERLALWIESRTCMVRDRDTGEIVPLVLRPAQHDLLKVMYRQATAGEPIRVIVPKARKQGISTLIQLLNYTACCVLDYCHALTVAHTAEAVRDLFGVVRIAHRFGPLAPAPAPTGRRLVLPSRGSEYSVRTVRGVFVGSGATMNLLHISELAKCTSAGGLDTEALSSLINSVPQLSPATAIIIESTGQGPVGEFWRRSMDAHHGRSDYTCCFLPWFRDPAYALPAAEALDPPADAYEQRLMTAHGVTTPQIAWYRRMRDSELGGNRVEMAHEYPSTIEESFESHKGRVLPTFQRETHVRKRVDLKLQGESDLYLGIDWGARKAPFVCLWLLHWPDAEPGYTIEPDCVHAIEEHMGWMRDDRTGVPMSENKHTPDAARYVIVTCHLIGHVHIAREIYVPDAASAGETHLTLGYRIRDALEANHEEPVDVIADRAEPLTIQTFRQHVGLSVRPYKRPRIKGHTDAPAVQAGALGEIEQGIRRMLVLINGTALRDRQVPTADDELRQRLQPIDLATGRQRTVTPTDDERRRLDELEREDEAVFREFGSADLRHDPLGDTF